MKEQLFFHFPDHLQLHREHQTLKLQRVYSNELRSPNLHCCRGAWEAPPAVLLR